MKTALRCALLLASTLTLSSLLFGSPSTFNCLDLSRSGVNDETIAKLRPMWESSLSPDQKTAITKLYLQKNSLGDLSTIELMRGASLFKQLTHLDLSNNFFTYKSLSSILKSYYFFSKIEFFNISNNLLSKDELKQLNYDVNHLVDSSKTTLPSLETSLVLTINSPTDRFQKYLESGDSLFVEGGLLALQKEGSSTAEFFSIQNDVEENLLGLLNTLLEKSYHVIKTCTLRIPDTPQAAQTFRALHRFLNPKKSVCIHTLDLSGIKLKEIINNTDSFAEFLQLASVRTLIARNCGIDEDFIKKLFVSLNKDTYRRNTTLTRLDICKNPINLEKVDVIEKNIPNFFNYRQFLKWEVRANSGFHFVVHPQESNRFELPLTRGLASILTEG